MIAATALPFISDGVPPPKKMVSTCGAVSCCALTHCELADNGLGPSVFVDRAAHMRIEVAIRTFGGAERPMDVDAEVAHGATINTKGL